MAHRQIYTAVELIGVGAYVSKRVYGGRYSANFATLAEAEAVAHDLNSTEFEYIRELVETELSRYCDFTGAFADGKLATNITIAVMQAK